MLDIGCGWGGLVEWAATRYGAACLGITLSRQQYEYARERMAEAGLSDRVEVRLQDYAISRARLVSTRSSRSVCMSMSGSPIIRFISAQSPAY
ncbi:MAG: class I SAM-dependent methyltransferase [Acetobacteraceae bacterium]|nr:class I SAM-dependent methyltransferase [Acetobacteraceae bacterium]